jgi:very-short-patch-repair endonuclease
VKENLKVADGDPRHADHFRIAADALDVERQRAELRRVWNGLFGEIGGPLIPGDESSPERWASSLAGDVIAALEWHRIEWSTVSTTVETASLVVERAIASVPASTERTAELDRLLRGVREVILPCPEKLHARALLREQEALLAQNRQAVGALRAAQPMLPLLQELEVAAQNEDPIAYRVIHRALSEVFQKSPLVQHRRELLSRFQREAPEWALAIRSRTGLHGAVEFPGDPAAAWLWKQLDQELSARARISLQELVRSLADATRQREEVTIALVDRLAWSGQFARVNLPMRQALIGFVETLRRIGAGTGQRVPRLLLQAQEQMRNAQGAVPVWIMPLNRVAETFDLRTTRFDVVIVDEASQLDLTGLLALCIAREVVIVGDHEQVEPLAVGERALDVQALIDEHLQGIPNAQLWDGKQSVYGLARQSFEPIPLREHFRCVPQIIAFSNRLSYNGSILPLREDSEVTTRPFVVAHHVKGSRHDGSRNLREAEELMALMVAASEQPEYAGKSFGVVSMVGDDNSPHVRLLQTLAFQYLGPQACEARRLRCGNSAQFQGDERDVMFLSMVDGPAEHPPLRLRSEDLYKKRFNVAASRARDQMWVIYSMDPDLDLKSGDLRKELIDHARDPQALERLYEEREPATESDFERRVLHALLASGYTQIQPQYRAGAYRIDFAIKHERLRIAIECDGDRFHTLDELDRDLERQSTLERCGWQFVRIRGSEFYRDPERTLERVVRDLQQLGVSPAHDGQSTPVETDLLVRVRTRAAELLREWRGEPDIDPNTHSSEQEATGSVEVSVPAKAGTLTPVALLRPDDPGTTARHVPTNTTQGQLDFGIADVTPPDPPPIPAADAIRSVLSEHRTVSRDELLAKCAQLMGRPLSGFVRSELVAALDQLRASGEVQNDPWGTIAEAVSLRQNNGQ